MKYHEIKRGKFVQRANRFIAEVVVDGSIEQVHVKNTGRLRELLRPGATVLLEKAKRANRKTKYSLIAVYKNRLLVNIDSLAPNQVVLEALAAGKIKEIGFVDKIKKEVTFHSSRFDLYYEKGEEKGFVEVKGVTLEENGVAMFPDAPTKRGTKHLLELMDAVEKGYTGTVLFLLQMKQCYMFTPNEQMDEEFTETLVQAMKRNVRILAYDTVVKENELTFDQPIPIQLPGIE